MYSLTSVYHYCVSLFTGSTTQCSLSDLPFAHRCSAPVVLWWHCERACYLLHFYKWELIELDQTANKEEPGFKRDLIVILAQLKIADAYIIIPRQIRAISLFSGTLSTLKSHGYVFFLSQTMQLQGKPWKTYFKGISWPADGTMRLWIPREMRWLWRGLCVLCGFLY